MRCGRWALIAITYYLELITDYVFFHYLFLMMRGRWALGTVKARNWYTSKAVISYK